MTGWEDGKVICNRYAGPDSGGGNGFGGYWFDGERSAHDRGGPDRRGHPRGR